MIDCPKLLINVCGCECSIYKVINSNLHCQAHDKMYFGATMLWEDYLCPKPEFQKWHKLKCLMGDYHQCGTNALPICPKESLHSNEWLVSWRCFKQEIIGLGKDGNPKKRVKKCFMETSTFTFLNYL